MFELNEKKMNRISLTRGDDAAFRIQPKYKDGVAYQLGMGDTMKMVVRKNYSSPVAFSCISDATGTLRIDHTMTKDLTPGYYVYDVCLITQDGKINTIINGATFELIQEVM